MIPLRQRLTGGSVTLGRVLGKGGQGTIFSIPSNLLVAAKVYHTDMSIRDIVNQQAKLQVMLNHPPTGAPTILHPPKGHVPFAWPVDLLLNDQRRCAGFLMPLIDIDQTIPLRDVYHPGDRRKVFPECTWKDLVHITSNVAAVVETLHATSRYVIGDLNESNLLVNRDSKLVTVVDCDSIQVFGDEGEVFLCPVGKADYLPPELHGQPLSVIARNKSQDGFSLAVIVFLMLMQGVHPFDGTWTADGTSRREERISKGIWPYDPDNRLRSQPRTNTLPLSFLPPNIQQLMRRCFKDGLRHSGLRPSAKEWHSELLLTERHLRRCVHQRSHYYGEHLSECPWCKMTQRTGADPFPETSRSTLRPFLLSRFHLNGGKS